MSFDETQPSLPSGPEAVPPPLPRRTPWGYGDMLLAVGLVILGAIVVSIPAALIGSAIAGDVDIEKDPNALAFVLGSGLFLEVIILLSALIFSVRKYGVSWADLGFRRPSRGSWWLPLALVGGALFVVYLYFALLSLAGVEPESSVPDEAFDSLAPMALLAVISLAFAPVMEETFFRGFIFGGLRGRWGLPWAAAASGVLFGLAHVGNPGTLYVVPPVAAVGALFALGYAYSGSLLSIMAAHFLFNLVSFLVGLAA